MAEPPNIASMLHARDLLSFGAPEKLVEVWSAQVGELTDIQEKAVRAGVLASGVSLLVVAPTSSGKTFIGEVAAASAAFARRGQAIFIVPFRALAEEHFELFRRRYADLLTVAISTSDHREFDADIRAGNVNLSVMTYEKLTGFLVQQPNLLSRCTTLVADELQLLSDPKRGADLEVVLTQALRAVEPPQLVALSASLDELRGVDAWLGAEAVVSSERPVPLSECVCEPSGSAVFVGADGELSRKKLVAARADREGLVLALAEKVVAEGKQVVVFRSRIAAVVQTARTLRDRLPANGLPRELEQRLTELEDSDAVEDLRSCLSAGVGFHSADLTHPERQLVEDAFRSGAIRALASTTTLAMGVNLPTDVAVVADSTRFVPGPVGFERKDISVAEYRNAAGRAGRLGRRKEGLAVLVAEDRVEQGQLVNAYLLGRVEPIESQIPRRAFADVVFDLIACGIASTLDAIVEFIASTFAYQSFYEPEGGGIEEVRASVGQAVEECLRTGLVLRDGAEVSPTRAGRVFASAGVSLRSTVRLLDALSRAVESGVCRAPIAYEVAGCAEAGERPWLRRHKRVELAPSAEQVPSRDGTDAGARLDAALTSPAPAQQRILVRAKCLLDWMDGDAVRAIARRFDEMGAAHARIRGLGESAAWLLETLAEAGRADGAPEEVIERLHEFALEARHGLPAPLAPLAGLRVRGVTRADLLALHRDERGLDLFVPENLLDRDDGEFAGLLTPLQLACVREAIVEEIHESQRLRHAGQRSRAEQANLPARLVDDLYTTSGKGLERAVADALNHAGVSAERLLRQPAGEEDIRLAHADGPVVVSVTASKHDARPVRWNKAKEILGAGGGLNPANCVCIARPGFDQLALRSADGIGRETGGRSILLVPVSVLAEAILRVSEGEMTADELGDLLARANGVAGLDDLEQAAGASAANSTQGHVLAVGSTESGVV
jgi:replicative superfamily II helicase